ncbi:hypothetical protein B1H10_02725 [candidate division KSB1 bacterium 4484_188]|nr:MAG: hypothetical protein B1H10_02725 [candidate division KSB1 bacterium 4484_188]
MQKILVTGACGQIGSELTLFLAKEFGQQNVIASDIKKATSPLLSGIPFIYLDVLDAAAVNKLVVENDIDTIFHMAAILSAAGEQNPQLAYQVNIAKPCPAAEPPILQWIFTSKQFKTFPTNVT